MTSVAYSFENDYRHKITTEMRVEALLYYFGWQGGTIHQLATETGLSVDILLYGPLLSSNDTSLSGGFSAIRTCDKDWRVNVLAPKHVGDWKYYADAIGGYWITKI